MFPIEGIVAVLTPVAAAAVVVVVAGSAVAAFAVRMTAEQRSKGFVLMGPFRVEQLK